MKFTIPLKVANQFDSLKTLDDLNYMTKVDRG